MESMEKKQWISWGKKLSLVPKILIVSVLLQGKLTHFSGGGVFIKIQI